VNTIDVRLARPEEYDAIGTLTTDIYVGGGFIAAASPYAAELADTAARAAVGDVLVAEIDGALVGSVTVARSGTSLAPIAAADELEFRMLAVAKTARGKGIGTTLVRHVLDLAAAEGLRAVVLSTMTPMVEARRLYERLGFERVPERDWEVVAGVLLPVYAYELSPARSR
jgi:ribosomal protein S18 acetylase RimI-like enzyme